MNSHVSNTGQEGIELQQGVYATARLGAEPKPAHLPNPEYDWHFPDAGQRIEYKTFVRSLTDLVLAAEFGNADAVAVLGAHLRRLYYRKVRGFTGA